MMRNWLLLSSSFHAAGLIAVIIFSSININIPQKKKQVFYVDFVGSSEIKNTGPSGQNSSSAAPAAIEKQPEPEKTKQEQPAKENKNELIHIRIEPTVKEKSEDIFSKLGINMSYAVSLFLNQVILKNGFPFNVELPNVNETEMESLAKIIESTGGTGEVSLKNQKIIHLYALGEIDYETAVFAIKRSFM